MGLEEEAVVGAEPPDDGVREVVGRRGLGLGGLAVGRAVHVARRPRRGVGEGRLPGVQEEGRDGLGLLARGGSAREEAETVSGVGERRLDATRARGYWLAEWRRRRGWAYSLACTGPPLPMLQNSNRPDRPTDCVVLSPAN